MKSFNKISITVETIVPVPVDKVWKYWTEPGHIKQWYHASDDWHAPFAENDLRVDGKFRTTMAANEEYRDFFSETWPKALEILKGICEEKGKCSKTDPDKK